MQYGRNKFHQPPKKVPMKPPFIDLQVSTWAKDSHALYDYQAVDNRFFNQTFQINKNCRIYRHITSMKTYVQYEEDKKQLPMENIYICSVFLDEEKKKFRIQSADISGVLPHPFLRSEHPDIFRNSYVVIRDFDKDEGNEGYPLQIGNYVKIGRIEYLVIQVRDSKGTKTLKQTSHLELNKDVHKVTPKVIEPIIEIQTPIIEIQTPIQVKQEQSKQQDKQETQQLKQPKIQKIQEKQIFACKICLCDEETESDPLITPCKCTGSCQFVHTGCLQNWINSKVKRQLNGICVSYNFSKFQCEICKTLLPKAVDLGNGVEVEMITFEKPTKSYIVLQSVTEKHQRPEQLKERNLHVICPEEKFPVKLGRGHQCEIRITDISVSRTHAQIRLQNDKFYVKDLKSKFGTLIKFREQFELNDRIRVQYGRTCFDFLLTEDEITEQDLIEQQLASRPIFETRAQRRARGQISDEQDN